MRPKLSSSVIKVSADADLCAALAQAAADERTSVSEVARRALRQGLAGQTVASPPRSRAA